MEIEKIKEELKKLDEEIREKCSNHEEEIYPIFDGALHNDYFSSKIKIVWLLKEAYEDGEREGDWSYPEFYQNNYDDFYKNLVRGKSNSTWQTIIYTIYGILNDYILYDEMDFIHEKPEMAKVLNNVAIVNIQKLPSETGSRTDIHNIHFYHLKHKDLLHRQLDLLKPQIIICANVFDVIKNDLEQVAENKYGTIEYYLIGGRLYINAYHPANTTITKEKYVNDIICCVRDFSYGNLNFL